MKSDIVFTLMLALWPIIYLLVLAYLGARKGWPVRAGIASMLVAAFPLLYLLAIKPAEHVDVPGTGFLLLLTLVPLALSTVIIAAGIAVAFIRAIRRRGAPTKAVSCSLKS